MTVSERAWVAWLDRADPRDHDLLGGKCASLAASIQADYGVPDGFAVTTEAFRRFVAGTGLAQLGEEESDGLDRADLAAVGAVSARMTKAFEEAELPADVEESIRAAYAELEERTGVAGVPVAVRSSGVAEDLEGASFAGQYDTYLWVLGADSVIAHIKRCWSGLFGRTLSYFGLEDGELPAIAVAVQRMVEPRAAGVMLTLDPVTGDRSKIVIESSWGLGEAVVGGEVSPDRFRIEKVTREVIDRTVGTKEKEYVFEPGGGIKLLPVPRARQAQASLDDVDLRKLTDLARQIERDRGGPQDIEWAIDSDGAVHLLQVRPETVWSSRPAAPVSVAGAGTMDLILKKMGAA